MRPRSRLAFTLVEVLVGVALSGLVVGTMLTIYFSTTRMGFFGELSGTLQEGALAMAIVQRDLTQAVQQPGRLVTGAVIMGRNQFKLIRVRMQDDGNLAGDKIRYTWEETSAGNFRIKRSVNDAEGRYLPGLFTAVPKIEQLGGVGGGPFVRVTMTLATRDVAEENRQFQGVEKTVLTSLTRVMGPEGIQGEMTHFDMFEELDSFVAWLLD